MEERREGRIAVFLGGRRHGEEEQLASTPPTIEFPISPKNLIGQLESDELPKLVPIDVETYIRTNKIRGRWFYIEKSDYDHRVKVDKIKGHQKQVAYHLEEINRLKFNK